MKPSNAAIAFCMNIEMSSKNVLALGEILKHSVLLLTKKWMFKADDSPTMLIWNPESRGQKQLEATRNLLNGLVTDLDPDHDEDRTAQLTLWLLPIPLPRLQKNLKKKRHWSHLKKKRH